MNQLKILGTGCAIPQRHVDSRFFDEHFHKPTGWVHKKLGIQSRYFVTQDESSLTMAKVAIDEALVNSDLDIQQIDCIIGACGTMHQHIPYNAALFQALYPEVNGQSECFDVNMTCLSFVRALDLANSLSTRYKHILIVSSEVASVGLNYQSVESTCIFGDGAAAVVVSASDQSQFLGSLFRTYSEGAEYCQIPAGGSHVHPSQLEHLELSQFHFQMNGRKLFRLVQQYLPQFNRDFEQEIGCALQDFDWLIPHQASRNSMEGVRKLMGFDESKFFSIFENYGNQIAASIPFALHKAIDSGALQRGQRVLLMGTSAGVSIGGVAFEY